MRSAKFFVLVIVLVMLYDLAIAVGAGYESMSGNRKLLILNPIQQQVGPIQGALNTFAGNVGGIVNGAVDTVGALYAQAAAPAIALCF